MNFDPKWIVGILLAIIGIILTILASEKLKNSSKRFFLGIIGFYRHIRFLMKLEEWGIKQVYRTTNEAWWAQRIPSILTEIKEVKTLGTSLQPIMNLGNEPIKKLLEKGCKFEFIVLDPNPESEVNSSEERAKADKDGMPSSDNSMKPGVNFLEERAKAEKNPALKEEVEGFIEWIKNTFPKEEYGRQIKIWVYNLMPTMAITIINDNILFVNPFLLLRRNQEAPVIEIHKGGSLFELYKEEYEEVLRKHAKHFFP